MLRLARTALNITEDKPLISFPSWLTLWTNTINPCLFVVTIFYSCYRLKSFSLIQAYLKQKEVPLMARKSSRKTLKYEKKPQVNFNELLQWALKCVCVHTFISHIIFFYFFIRTGTEASLFWASLVLVLDILCSVLRRFWLFYLKGL